MFVEHSGAAPVIDSSATIAPGAIISGEVFIGPHSVVLPGAVITSQGARVQIGERCIIMEQAVIRGAGVHPTIIGDHVLVGPHAHVSGATIERCSFVATGATILNGSVVGEGSVVAVNAVVHIDTRCPALTLVPIGHIAIGSPAAIYPPDQADAIPQRVAALGFTRVVFGFDSSSVSNAEATRQLCDRYSRALSSHTADRILPG